MDVNKVVLASILFASLMSAFSLAYATNETLQIPEWIKNNARFWADGKITDNEYVVALQYLLDQRILKVSNMSSPSEIPFVPRSGSDGIMTTVRTNSSYSIGSDGIGEISCKENETLVSGGYNSNFHEGLSVYENGPSLDGKKWIVVMLYTPGSASGGIFYGNPPTFDVYALCARLGSS